MNKKVKSLVFWILYSLYIFFFYHLALIPFMLEFTLYGSIVLVATVGLALYLLAQKERKPLAVYTLLFLLLIKALAGLDKIESLWMTIFSFGFIFLICFAIARFYGKLPFKAIGTLLILGTLLNAVFIRSELPLLTDFTTVWRSDPLYKGTVANFFPLLARDIDHDGKPELITLGNTGEEKAPGPNPTVLQTEQLHLYAYKWNGKTMVRIPEQQLDRKSLVAQLPPDYIGFPYYILNDQLQLIPQMQRIDLTRKAMGFGEAPFLAMYLDIRNLSGKLQERNGIMAEFKDISIQNGELKGVFHGVSFTFPTDATTVLGPIRLGGGQEGLAITGKSLTILTVNQGGSVTVTHQLTEKDLPDIATSEFIIADVDQDGKDEILVSSSYSRIIKPAAGGKWENLWTARDNVFRFENFTSVGSNANPELIVQEKSLQRNLPIRFPAGYTYSPNGLQQKWKVFVPLVNIQAGDFTGDGKNELAAFDYGNQRVVLLKEHGLPVVPILWGILVLLLGFLAVRRLRKS